MPGPLFQDINIRTAVLRIGRHRLEPIDISPWTKRLTLEQRATMRHKSGWQSRENFRILSSEDFTQHGWLWHISLSHPNRYPTWDELLAAKEIFFGDVDCMMVMPKKEDYVNLHKFAFHIWKTPVNWDVQ